MSQRTFSTFEEDAEMAFLLGVCRYDLGDVHDTTEVMERIISLCLEGRIGEARDQVEATKQHIAGSRDLSGRPYIVRRFGEVIGIVDRAERRLLLEGR